MNIFKSRMLKWWQVSLLKITVLAFGVAIGANWPDFFVPYTWPLLILTVVLSVYLGIVWFKQ